MIATAIIILSLTAICFYLTRRFKWIKLGESHVLYYKNYQAMVNELELGGAMLEIYIAPAKHVYTEALSTMTVRKAKRIVEDKILEYEQKQQEL